VILRPGRPWLEGCSDLPDTALEFLDTAAPVFGDLQGIIRRLDYVASLGVDAIWLTPFYEVTMEGIWAYDYHRTCSTSTPYSGLIEGFEELLIQLPTIMGSGVDRSGLESHLPAAPMSCERAPPAVTTQSDGMSGMTHATMAPRQTTGLSGLHGTQRLAMASGRRLLLANFLPCQPESTGITRSAWRRVDLAASGWTRASMVSAIDAVNFFVEGPCSSVTRSAHRRWDFLTGSSPISDGRPAVL